MMVSDEDLEASKLLIREAIEQLDINKDSDKEL
jgi:hypothetical protein